MVPGTPVQRSSIQPVISPVPVMMVLETPASTPSIIVTPSSPIPTIEPAGAKAAAPVDKMINQEYKDNCATVNNGKWTKSSKGGDIFVVDGHGYMKKDLRKSKTGKITVYLKCVNSSCGAPNRLLDSTLFDKEHKGNSCLPDPTLF